MVDPELNSEFQQLEPECGPSVADETSVVEQEDIDEDQPIELDKRVEDKNEALVIDMLYIPHHYN